MVKAKLVIDGKEINVLWFTYGYRRGADATGRPSPKTVFIGLKLIIEARKDLNLADWSFSPNQTKQIELHIYPVVMGGKTREIYFYDCHLVNWENVFSATGTNPMSETLEITSAGIKDSNSMSEYSAYWRTTYPAQDVEPTVLENSNEKKFTNYYLTDTENNSIDGYDIGDTVILNIETENRIGDVITVDLNEKEYDFEHNGKVLINDIIKNININNDLEQIELKVVVQNA
ncbi:type VI secretion system tube protein TssD [Tenacibaculum sp.]|nr:type VI secretion system tube protein TssD [Tenacibaculum sp.]